MRPPARLALHVDPESQGLGCEAAVEETVAFMLADGARSQSTCPEKLNSAPTNTTLGLQSQPCLSLACEPLIRPRGHLQERAMPPSPGLIVTTGESRFTNLNNRVQKNNAQPNMEGTNIPGSDPGDSGNASWEAGLIYFMREQSQQEGVWMAPRSHSLRLGPRHVNCTHHLPQGR